MQIRKPAKQMTFKQAAARVLLATLAVVVPLVMYIGFFTPEAFNTEVGDNGFQVVREIPSADR